MRWRIFFDESVSETRPIPHGKIYSEVQMNHMNYEYQMEELVPLVAALAEKYTAHESTSLPYEKAEQLMGAVLYCIRENGMSKPECVSVSPAKPMTARQAYEAGAALVAEKVQKTLDLYHEILPGFRSYKNRCLHDTFTAGMPEFFRWYDIKFCPQDTILTLDYPVLRDLSAYTGIDRIYAYLRCICLEQEFLHCFPEDNVRGTLYRYDRQYKDIVENICEIVLRDILIHVLAGKPLEESDVTGDDHRRIRDVFRQTGLPELTGRLENSAAKLVREHCGGSPALAAYLTPAVEGIVLRLSHSAFPK